ncbi:MAG: Polysulfide reductase, NrfD [candidate division BRC1 bacterium ADurb.BinA364]|nr:MAG: Polysulfide reductase, NrfD [candidate division BRC1 bacterium ADurb.BinA364]
MSRDVTWGFYIAQFTFLVGVAASAVMVVLPYYLHDFKAFGKITILGEFLAIASVTMCVLFIFVDLGQPLRVLNVLLHPTPGSVMFWDMIVLNGYLLLNALIGLTALESERKGVKPPAWVKPLVYLSIPWAVSIHTVTAFLYNGLEARPFWLTAILAPRFLASAFASGPAILILLCLLVRKVAKFDAGKEAIQKLAVIVCYAMIVSVFFVLLEFFTVFYSGIPEHTEHFTYLFFGLEGHGNLVPWMWTAAVLAIASIALLLTPRMRQNEAVLGWACAAAFLSMWIDKGMGLIIAGFVPSPLKEIHEYSPTAPELAITLGVYAIGALVLTVLYKLALAVRGEIAQ